MKSNKTITKRIQRLWRDSYSIIRLHGFRTLFLYLFVKLSQIPLLPSLFQNVYRKRILTKTKILGSWMYLDLRDPGISRQLLIYGMRELGHVEQIQMEIGLGMKGLEIGANIGYYALLEGRLVGPSGHIYCIEPAPANIELLRKNISENRFHDRISTFQCLAGDTVGTKKLFLSVAANSHSIAAISDTSIQLPMVTIDYFLAREHIDSAEIDFVRMDIEGYEVMVIPHMESLFRNRKTPLKLFIELHPHAYPEWGWTLEKFVGYLMNCGFVPKSIAKKISLDGVVREGAVDLKGIREPAELANELAKAGSLDNVYFELPGGAL